MRTTSTPTRLLAATLAIGALSVSAADARPIDVNSPVGHAVVRGHLAADLRSADAREAARLAEQRVQELRHLEAGNPATANLRDSSTKPPTPTAAIRGQAQARYYASYGHPQTIHRTVTTDDGTPWLTIAGSLAGICLVLGGSAAIAGRRPRSHGRSPRVAV